MEQVNIGNMYRRFIAHLKILHIRAQYNGETEKAEYYRNIYGKLESVRERRHLSTIKEERKEKKAFEEVLEVMKKMSEVYTPENENEIFERVAKYLNKLLEEKYEIKIESKKDQKAGELVK